MNDSPIQKFSFKKFLADAAPASDNAAPGQETQYVKSNVYSSRVEEPKGSRIEEAGSQREQASSQMEQAGSQMKTTSSGMEEPMALGASMREEAASRDESAEAAEMDADDYDVELRDVLPRGRISDAMRAEIEEMQALANEKMGWEDEQIVETRVDQEIRAMRKENDTMQDKLARERMMYEGSDRDTMPARPRAKKFASGKPVNDLTEFSKDGAMAKADAVLSRAQKMKQKFAANKPMTKRGVIHRPRLIGVCNQKGGVGKTTTAINLATALCAVGKSVLLIDMDPQGNATTGLGVRRSAIRTSVYDVLFGDVDAVEASVSTRVPGLSIIPSSIHLSGAEIELVTADNREYRLKNALHRNLPYDYVIVDCPPSLNLLTLNTLVAMDSILVPLQCEFYALEGLSHLVKTIERVKKSLNPGLDIQGLVLTMYDARNKLSSQVEADVREHFGDKVYKTVIPRNVRLSEAPSYGLPAIIYDMKCSGAQAYIKLAREVILRERKIAEAANEAGNDSAQVA